MDKQKLWDAAVAHNGLDVMGWDKAPMITIENPDELESLMTAIQSAAAPQVVADEQAVWRAAGRAEALSILMDLCPETGIDEYTGWNTSGSPEDEGCAHWNEEKLRELLHVDSALADMMSKAEAAYYDYRGQKDEAERAKAFAANMHGSGRVREVLAKAGEYELIGDLCRAAAPVQAQEPVCDDCDGRGFNYSESAYGGDGFMQPPDPPTQERCEVCEGSGIAPPDSELIAPVQPVAVPDGWASSVKKLVGQLEQYQLCMSYNDSYFTEPAGLVKQTVRQLSKLMDDAPAAQGDAKDAERYRYIRDTETIEAMVWEALDGDGSVNGEGELDRAGYAAGMDRAIDAAIAAKAAS